MFEMLVVPRVLQVTVHEVSVVSKVLRVPGVWVPEVLTVQRLCGVSCQDCDTAVWRVLPTYCC